MTPRARRVPRLLLTGFLPFGGHAVNPAEQVVRRVAESPPRGVRLTTLVLPVSYRRAFDAVRAALSTDPPDAVLHLGLAAGRTRLEFERFALNWRGAAAPDEDGLLVVGEPIDPAGPAARLATVPVDDLVAACTAAGVPALGSNHAGTFLCNQVLYQTLQFADRAGLALRAGFLHLPGPAEPGAGTPDLDAATRGVETALLLLARPRRGGRPGGRTGRRPVRGATSALTVRPTPV